VIKMINDITICSVVHNDNNSGLFDLMVRSVYKYTSEEPRFIICDAGNNSLDKYASLSNFTIVPSNSNATGSLQHGESLNQIFNLVSTKRFAIVESDCIILEKGWDDIGYPKHKFLACLKQDGCKPGRPMYHACFMVGGTQLLRHGGIIDFRPGKDGNRSSRSYNPWEDVGWQLYDKIKIGGQVNEMTFVDCKSGKGQYFDGKFQSDEFWRNGKAIMAHFGRGSNIGGKAIRKGFRHPKEQLAEWKKRAEEILR